MREWATVGKSRWTSEDGPRAGRCAPRPEVVSGDDRTRTRRQYVAMMLAPAGADGALERAPDQRPGLARRRRRSRVEQGRPASRMGGRGTGTRVPRRQHA
jgi:hypothetical protein